MLTVAFFNHDYLVERELLSALRRIPGVRLVVVPIVDTASREQAHAAAEALAAQGARVLITVNNGGMDPFGVLAGHLEQRGIFHVNWHVDDPFFAEIMLNRFYPPKPNRLDFVSDRGAVEYLQRRGYQAHFLPLAADVAIFHPDAAAAPVRDICFVGNSYRMQIDEYVKDCDDFMEQQIPFLRRLLALYAADMQYPVEHEIADRLKEIALPAHMTRQKVAYIMKHFIGYLFRKRVVLSLAEKYADFMVFGDEYWACDLEPRRVSCAVGYYTNLCQTYQQTRVNIDINRMVIRDGFTQRVFDCLASRSFIITSPKNVVAEYFVTEGPNREVVVFQNEMHLLELIDYYLKHEEERREIAQRGHAKVIAYHTYAHRVRSIFAAIARILGAGALNDFGVDRTSPPRGAAAQLGDLAA